MKFAPSIQPHHYSFTKAHLDTTETPACAKRSAAGRQNSTETQKMSPRKLLCGSVEFPPQSLADPPRSVADCDICGVIGYLSRPPLSFSCKWNAKILQQLEG